MGQGSSLPLPCSALPASLALPRLASPCLTRMTGLTLSTSLRKCRRVNLLGPLLPQCRVTYSLDPLPTWNFLPHFPDSIRKKGLLSHPSLTLIQLSLCSSISPRTWQPQTMSSKERPRPPSLEATPALHLTTAPQPRPPPAVGGYHPSPQTDVQTLVPIPTESKDTCITYLPGDTHTNP